MTLTRINNLWVKPDTLGHMHLYDDIRGHIYIPVRGRDKQEISQGVNIIKLMLLDYPPPIFPPPSCIQSPVINAIHRGQLSEQMFYYNDLITMLEMCPFAIDTA